jgi:phosphatidylglycerophosphate synthase
LLSVLPDCNLKNVHPLARNHKERGLCGELRFTLAVADGFLRRAREAGRTLKTNLPTERPTAPALIFCDELTSGLKIAALTLLDRLVVTVHRAGAGPITIVSRQPLPSLERSHELGIKVRVVPEPSVVHHPTLVTGTGLLVQPADVRLLLQHNSRLTTADGVPLPVGVLPQAGTGWQAALDQLPERAAQGVAMRVTDVASARAAERALWASLTSSSDGLVDRFFNRPGGRFLSKILVHTSVSPNTVSLVSILIGVVAAGGFALGDYRSAVMAAILFQISAIVDCVDGDLARVLFKESALGKWLDLIGDQIVHVSVFAGIAAGLLYRGEVPAAGWLGFSAVAGALLSFVVVLRGMRLPADQSHSLQKLIDAATNRDFSVLVLALACFNRLEWFLWMAAMGSHLFWMTALVLQFRSGTKAGATS